MVSIRDYAKMNNVSYEAIRQQVKRYEDELNGHIIKQNRTQFLDDVAVDILDQHRKENPCAYLTDQIIQGLINSQEAKYEVSQYIYKDSACPYPINSLQCSQPPYAYTKTYLKRVS